jgi:omega-amidase
MRITLVQTKLFWENPAQNLAQLEEKLAPLAGKTDLILLPEMFTTGFTMKAITFAETERNTTYKWLKLQSAKLDSAIVGSFIFRKNNKYFNRLVFITPDGGYSDYDKRHLFSLAGEDKTYTAGDKRLIVEWRGWRICPQICYDLRFPAFSRNKIGRDGYDLLLYVANWPKPRIQHWKTLLEARAIENQSFVAGLNIVGTDGNQHEYSGDSMIFDCMGKKILDLGNSESVQTIEIELSAQNEWRQKFPALADADVVRVIR